MVDSVDSLVILKVTGSRIDDPALPALLRSDARRGAPLAPDPFLPDEYLRVVDAFDMSATGRAAPFAQQEAVLTVKPGQVLVLELPDGTTLITSGLRLQEELERVDPAATSRGELKLDEVRPPGATSRGIVDSLGHLVSRLFVLERAGVADGVLDAALDQAQRWAGNALADKLRDGAHWGINYWATRALMWSIERQLLREPGLYRWVGAQKATSDLFSLDDERLAREAREGPLLVFIHGTASCTTGSFGDLRSAALEAQLDWDALEVRYGPRIYGLEHRTFSESPIENALMLARTLPAGAQIDLVTHSRGGLVGDLLCVDYGDVDETQALIDGYARFRTRDNRDAHDLDQADAEDRKQLLALSALLRTKELRIGRYVRVAAPVNGTLLAGSHLDLFLSTLLTLVGAVTTLQASPFYLALKRIVLEVARNRADPNRIPGIEAMLPGSALSRLLRLAKPRKDLRLGVIAGDIEGASRFKRLIELLADWVFFERNDNDLVVDTASMDAGVARADNARRQLVHGPTVDHFSYFGSAASRSALAGWLTATDLATVREFDALPPSFAEPRSAEVGTRAGAAGDAERSVVIVLPDSMGSHLQAGSERVWFNALGLGPEGLAKLSYSAESPGKLSAEKLFAASYGDLCAHLEQTHRVICYPYDWRRPVQDAAQGLARTLRDALAATEASKAPVRILAHGMGGLVVRAMAAADAGLWEQFLTREASRFIMLGTPNQGSHAMVETLLGKSAMVRNLGMLDARHDLQGLLDLLAACPGVLQLLPRPGFEDASGAPSDDYFRLEKWTELRGKLFDFWFGDGKGATPSSAVCKVAGSLWELADFKVPRIPGSRPEKVLYVYGKADNTPCGIRLVADRVKMLGTPAGDGSVSWASGKIDGIGAAYLMDAAHADLVDTRVHFEALVELLVQGRTDRLRTGWPPPLTRGEQPPPVVYDAGPAVIPTAEGVARSLLGVSRRRRSPRAAPEAVLQVSCAAMDLRYARDPVLVGHYERDTISGAEAQIDQTLVVHELTLRKQLGLYPGAIGTSAVVLLEANAEERLRQSQRGAVVTGLGEWGELTLTSLVEAVRVAVLRYLLTVSERGGDMLTELGAQSKPIDVGLSSLLVGFSSTATISVEDSVYALVRGVLEANRQFADAQRGSRCVRIVRLEIIEVFLDVAISAARALRAVADRLEKDVLQRAGMRLEAASELKQGKGARPRLEVLSQLGHWPRLIVTDASPRKSSAPAAQSMALSAPERTRQPLAERLRYVFLAQRARAESEVLQRQPGLVEALVKLSIDRQSFDPDISHTLFQLMVPLELKQALRQTDHLALLVDRHTADMPWELLSVDGEPLVKHTAIVRQLASTECRERLRSAVDKVAYVVGNPSTAGFGEAFPGKAGKGNLDPRPLPGAEAEANAVAAVLRGAGYQLVESIGEDQSALDVINRLFQRPYRIVHVAAHGEFEIEAANGSRRSGVLLSDGLMLTAAEIRQMEIVPDLVFLNCCHLGRIDGKPAAREVAYNKLASSLSRELIKMGVRAVVVAGWAVDDQAAQLFSESFYHHLVDRAQPFGMAVHNARCETYREYPNSNTWGAYQAYGDQGFLIDPSQSVSKVDAGGESLVAVQELLLELENLRLRVGNASGAKASNSVRSVARQIDQLLSRSPKAWCERGDVLYAMGVVFADLGPQGFERASECLLKAVQAEGENCVVPIRAIEQLANLEARSGAQLSDSAPAAQGQEQSDTGRARLERGAARIQLLAQVVADAPDRQDGYLNSERCALIGSAWKRRASGLVTQGREFRSALENARDWYRRGEGEPDTPRFSPYCALNRLMLDALLGVAADAMLARKAGDAARARFALTRNYWDAMMPADARLCEALLDGALAAEHTSGPAIKAVLESYRQVRSSVPEDVLAWTSVVQQPALLARFAAALGNTTLAENLQQIVAHLTSPSSPGQS